MQKINFRNLPDTTTPVSAETLNLLQENVENEINQNTDTFNNDLNKKYTKFLSLSIITNKSLTASTDNKILFDNVDVNAENIIYSNSDGTITINDDNIKFAIIVSRIRLTASSDFDYSFVLKKNENQIVANSGGHIFSWSKANLIALIPIEKGDKLSLAINPSIDATIQGAGGLAGMWANAELLFFT